MHRLPGLTGMQGDVHLDPQAAVPSEAPRTVDPTDGRWTTSSTKPQDASSERLEQG
jgi:hypothetical protein